MKLCIWTIAGNDPSQHSGAGRDSEVIEALGCEACALLSAVTAQNRKDFLSSYPLEPAALEAQAMALLKGGKPAAVKVGMLPTAEHVKILARLAEREELKLVIDPVVASSTGGSLVSVEAVAAIGRCLLLHAALVTPNLREAELLTGESVASRDDYPRLAKKLLAMGAQAVLIKDGHGEGEVCDDYFSDGNTSFVLRHPRYPKDLRGTGCFLSAAIAACYGKLESVAEAVIVGTACCSQTIRRGSERLPLPSWPVTPEDFPIIPSLVSLPGQFPSMRDLSSPFYPVVPNAIWVERLCHLGVKVLQLRIKDRVGPELELEIARAVALCEASGCQLFVNDHWELAIKYQAFGVHLGQEDIQSADWNALGQSGLRLGISTHSYEELARALAFHPSYIALGPIFPTSSKEMRFSAQGLERLGIWAQLCDLPIVAIGGLNPERARSCLESGASLAACISDLTTNPEPVKRAQEWMELTSQ